MSEEHDLRRDRDEWREQHENLLAIGREQTEALHRRTELLRRTLAYLPSTLGVVRQIRDELPPANESTDEVHAFAAFAQNMSDAELIDRHRGDILALDDAVAATIYGGLFDAFSGETYTALRNAGLIRSYIPAGCMAPITKLTPKGRKVAANLRALAKAEGGDQ